MENIETTEINGVKFRCRPEDKGVITEAFDEDCYHFSEIPENSMVVDIGAHIGTFALRCAIEKSCKVYAYEPCPANFFILNENIYLNNAEGKVQPLRFAIGGCIESRRFYYRSNHPTGSLLYRYDDVEATELFVDCLTLKEVFAILPNNECDILKIDCEGAEREIFRSEFALYIKQARNIMLEWHEYDGAYYKSFLAPLGYKVVLTGTGSPQPIYDSSFGRGMLYARSQSVNTGNE